MRFHIIAAPRCRSGDNYPRLTSPVSHVVPQTSPCPPPEHPSSHQVKKKIKNKKKRRRGGVIPAPPELWGVVCRWARELFYCASKGGTGREDTRLVNSLSVVHLQSLSASVFFITDVISVILFSSPTATVWMQRLTQIIFISIRCRENTNMRR